MSKLTIVANIKAAPGKIDLVKAELEKLIPITRAEAGCIQSVSYTHLTLPTSDLV